MKRILMLSIILLSNTNKINCGNWLSASSKQEEETKEYETWNPNATNNIENLLNNIKIEMEKYFNTLDYSSFEREEDILRMIERNLNSIIKENPETFPAMSSVLKNLETFQNNQEFQKQFSDTIKEKAFSIARQKCLELNIPITEDKK